MIASAYYADTFDHAVRVGALSIGGIVIALVIALTIRAFIHRHRPQVLRFRKQRSGVTVVQVPDIIDWDQRPEWGLTDRESPHPSESHGR